MGVGNYESEALRLQREADNFTKHFEHEKKRLMILEDQYKQACDELNQKKTRLNELPSTHKFGKDNARCKVLENRLDQSLVKYNRLQAENQGQRRQIDVMRKEQKNQTRVNENYEKELKGLNNKVLSMAKSSQ
jgi:hypothetical protein